MAEVRGKKKVKRVRVYSEAKRLYAHRKMIFQDKVLYLDKPPRTGVCSNCGKKVGDHYVNSDGKDAVIKRTHMHHEEYHPDDVLKDAVELCVSCHIAAGWRLGQFSGETISMVWKRKREERPKRYCYACGSDKTTVNKDYNCERWTLNRGTDLVLCRKCTRYILRQ